MESGTGVLYLCATPIGNLGDITLRVIRILAEADMVWAEDTRRTLGLLNHLGIKKPVISCHQHNEQARASELVLLLQEGKQIAYCSDAGMPGISDPGYRLVLACIENGLNFTVLPGASALLMAGVLSGLPIDKLSFYGFLPRVKKERGMLLARLKKEEKTFLLYESPERVITTVNELYQELGDRPAALLRELTKLHEECIRGTLGSLCKQITTPPRGECVLAIAGCAAPEPKSQPDAMDTAEAISKLLKEGLSTKDTALCIAVCFNLPKKEAYRRVLTCIK